ncbi:hypothetical protein [Pseudomonas aeruginosa]
MARKQCQVCGQPATVRVEANLNGRHSTMLVSVWPTHLPGSSS